MGIGHRSPHSLPHRLCALTPRRRQCMQRMGHKALDFMSQQPDADLVTLDPVLAPDCFHHENTALDRHLRLSQDSSESPPPSLRRSPLSLSRGRARSPLPPSSNRAPPALPPYSGRGRPPLLPTSGPGGSLLPTSGPHTFVSGKASPGPGSHTDERLLSTSPLVRDVRRLRCPVHVSHSPPSLLRAVLAGQPDRRTRTEQAGHQVSTLGRLSALLAPHSLRTSL
jgi:hypothetical protein